MSQSVDLGRITASLPNSLYVRHLAGLMQVVHFLEGHWESFSCLVVKDDADGVHEKQVMQSIHDLGDRLTDYLTRVLVLKGEHYKDATYMRELKELVRCAEYRDMSELGAIEQIRTGEHCII